MGKFSKPFSVKADILEQRTTLKSYELFVHVYVYYLTNSYDCTRDTR